MTDATANGRAGQLRAATRRLLARIGSTALPQQPQDPLSKPAAIARAVAAVPHRSTGVRVWLFADATLVHGLWLCVLEDTQAVHVVEVGAFDGQTHVLATVQRRRDASKPAARARATAHGGALPHLLGCGWPRGPEEEIRRVHRRSGRRRYLH